MQRIGLVMAWAEMNDIAISAGFAVEERATQINSQENGLVELQKFSEIFDYYPMRLWLDVAEGRVSEIAPIQYTRTPAKNITANYATGNDHYYMAVASLIHMVSLYRDDRLSPAEKIKDFFKWMIDNLLVSEYILTYTAPLCIEKRRSAHSKIQTAGKALSENYLSWTTGSDCTVLYACYDTLHELYLDGYFRRYRYQCVCDYLLSFVLHHVRIFWSLGGHAALVRAGVWGKER